MTTTPYSIRQALDDANPNILADALRQVGLGTHLRKIKATIASMSASSTPDVTAIPASKITINEGPKSVRDSGLLPPIGHVKSLRVSASGTGTVVGSYFLTDASGTAVTASTSGVAGIAKIGDDDKTLTFTATITGFVIEYFAKPGSYLTGGKWDAVDIDSAVFSGADGVAPV